MRYEYPKWPYRQTKSIASIEIEYMERVNGRLAELIKTVDDSEITSVKPVKKERNDLIVSCRANPFCFIPELIHAQRTNVDDSNLRNLGSIFTHNGFSGS